MLNLKRDPVRYLAEHASPPVKYLLMKNIMNDESETLIKLKNELKKFKPRIRLLKSQRADGTWPTSKTIKRKGRTHNLRHSKLIVLRNMRRLLDFSSSIEEGYNENSLRFLLNDQYPTGYIPSPIDIEYKMDNGENVYLYDPQFCGEVIALCSSFGLWQDKKIKLAFKWFNKNQRLDGGFLGTWHIHEYVKAEKPKKKSYKKWWKELLSGKKIPSHIVASSAILEAYTSNPEFIKYKETKLLAKFILRNTFKQDLYRQIQKNQWFKLRYPNPKIDILKVLDLTTKAGFTLKNDTIKTIVDWLVKNQKNNGSWENDEWVTYKVVEALNRLELKQ
ncbi:MAG: hypothetical protein ACTSQY_04915 [Candidatus Odinarchaeia archaeon]